MKTFYRVSACVALVMLIVTVVALRSLGRFWWCECGGFSPWVSNVDSAHTSQHLFDPYSFTHISHGFLFCGLLILVCPVLPTACRFAIAVSLECVWEIFENTPFVINRYRDATAALGYSGDSIANSLADVLSCAIGFLIATKLGWRYTFLLFGVFETVLLLTIRDSLLLNIIMLCCPIESLKQWQLR